MLNTKTVKHVSSLVAVKNLTRWRTPSRSVFSIIAKNILPGWDISLVFVGAARAKALNNQLRKKNYVPNVLSYTLGGKSGEIIICLSEAAQQAPSYKMGERTFVLYLFIHGALHIKGWAHGVRMEKCEQKLLATYGTAHSNRYRYRHVPSKDGRRRGSLR